MNLKEHLRMELKSLKEKEEPFSKPPKVSVVIVTYNQEHTIAATIESILNQKTTYTVEILIGEDGSQDGTREVVERFVNSYPSIVKLLPKAPNKGIIRNYRDVIQECSGKYITQCAGDDYWHNSSKLQLQVDFLESNPEFGVVHSEVDLFIDNEDGTIKANGYRRCPEGHMGNIFYKVNFIYAVTVCYRRELLKFVDFDAFIENNFVAEDHALWLEFANHTKFHYLRESLATYRITTESISRSDDGIKRLRFVAGIYKIVFYFYNKHQPKGLDWDSLERYYRKWYLMEAIKYSTSTEAEAVFEKPFSPIMNRYLSSRAGKATFYFINIMRRKVSNKIVYLTTGAKPIRFV